MVANKNTVWLKKQSCHSFSSIHYFLNKFNNNLNYSISKKSNDHLIMHISIAPLHRLSGKQFEIMVCFTFVTNVLLKHIQVCDGGIFQKAELDIKSPTGPMVRAERKMFCFFSFPNLLENEFSNAREVFSSKQIYHICTFLPFLPQTPNFYIIFTRIITMKNRKTGILARTQKIKCLHIILIWL